MSTTARTHSPGQGSGTPPHPLEPSLSRQPSGGSAAPIAASYEIFPRPTAASQIMKNQTEKLGIEVTATRKCSVTYLNLSELSALTGATRETCAKYTDGMRYITRKGGKFHGKYFPSYRAIPRILGHADPGDSPMDAHGTDWPRRTRGEAEADE